MTIDATSSLPPNGKAIYPWRKWADGKAHKVQKGQHFQQTAVKFRNMLFAAAKRLGKTVATRVKGNTVWFQFTPVEPAKPKSKKPKK